MSALKCPQCGLVNFATATQCKRCGTLFSQNVSSEPGLNVQGFVLEDGYVLPAPPSVGTVGPGVWRDKAKLVVGKDVELPPRCIKFNAPAPGRRLKKKLTWHHPLFFLFIFVGFLVYFIVAMFVRKTATVELGLCEEHMAKHRRNVWITASLILLGILGFALAVIVGENGFLFVGILLVLAGIIFGVSVLKVVSPAMIDDRFVWLRGVNEDYLAMLPQWPGA